jgi:integrase
MNVSNGIRVYLDEKRPVFRPLTHEKYTITLENFALTHGQRDIASITRQDVKDWRDSFKVKPQSANKYAARLRSFFLWAQRLGFITTNPCDSVDALDEEPARRPRLPVAVLGQVLDGARNPRDRALVATGLELLLRGGELAALRVGDLDLVNRTVAVRLEKAHGELATDEMALSPALADELHSWLGDYRGLAGRELDPADHLFPHLVHRRRGTTSEYSVDPETPLRQPWRVVGRAIHALGPDGQGLRRVGFHTLRRSGARALFDHLSDERGPTRAMSHVSSLLHHKNRATTELYLGVTEDRAHRNEAIRDGSASVLALSSARDDEPLADVLALPAHRQITA